MKELQTEETTGESTDLVRLANRNPGSQRDEHKPERLRWQVFTCGGSRNLKVALLLAEVLIFSAF